MTLRFNGFWKCYESFAKPYEANMNINITFLVTCVLDWIWKRCLYFIHPNVAKSESYTKMCRSRWCGSFHGITDVMAFKNSSRPDQNPYRFNFAYVSPSHPRGDHKKEISAAALAVAYHRCVFCTAQKETPGMGTFSRQLIWVHSITSTTGQGSNLVKQEIIPDFLKCLIIYQCHI